MNKLHIFQEKCDALSRSNVTSNALQMVKTHHEDMAVKYLLHPAIDREFIALQTAPDHNCMWNAICLCLGLPEDNQSEFRRLTVAAILENQSHFEQLLTPDRTTETINSLIESCLHPNELSGWGNEYHLLALAIGLNRNVFVYSSFRHSSSGRFFQDKRLDITDLADRFSKECKQTSQHLNYQPKTGIFSKSPICLFYNRDHYTALVPRKPNPVYCIPHQVIAQSIGSGNVEVQSTNVVASCESSGERLIPSPSTLVTLSHDVKTNHTSQLDSGKICISKWSRWYNNLSQEEKVAYKKKKAAEKDAKKRSEENKRYYEEHSNIIQNKSRKRQRTSYADPIKKEKMKTGCRSRKRKLYEDSIGTEKKAESKKKQKVATNEQNLVAPTGKSVTLSHDVKASDRNQLNIGKKRVSKWSRWYNNLSQDERIAYNKKKAAEKDAKKRSESNKRYYEEHSNIIQNKSRKRQRTSYADPEKKEKKKTDSRNKQKKSYVNPIKRELKKTEKTKRQKTSYIKKRDIILVANRKSVQNHRKKKKERCKDITYLLQQANLAMQEFPALACTVCHRARFKEQVKQCHRSKYPNTARVQNAMTGDYVHRCNDGCSDKSIYHKLKQKEWVCFTCDRHLKKGDVPPQAIVNGLRLEPIPEELKTLNPLERHLISIIQPFQKIVPLPKGGQKGVRGQMVCVPADLQKTADTLPWTPDTHSLIRVKLKRKLEYKGHHLFMTVSQDKIMKALMKLKENNPHYKDVKINDVWMREMVQRGYTQMVNELHVPTEEEQYEVYLEHKKEEDLLLEASNNMPTKEDQYEVYIESIEEDELLYDEAKYGKEMLQSLKIHNDIQIEEDEYAKMNTTNMHNETAYKLWVEEEQEFAAEYEKYTASYLQQQQYEAYQGGVEKDENTTIDEDVPSYDHPLDQNIEHPFQCTSLQQIDPSMSDGDILSFAPSEGKRPVHALQSESLCFPTIYPTGINSFLTKTETGDYIQARDRDISVTKYFDSRVLSIDKRFQSDSEWIFYAQYLKEVEQVHSAASIALKKGPAFTKQGQKITAGDLIDNDRLNKTVFRNKIGYRYIKDIPGTPPYWENTMNGLFASFKQIGPPSFFISFSAADRRWPEIAKAILA